MRWRRFLDRRRRLDGGRRPAGHHGSQPACRWRPGGRRCPQPLERLQGSGCLSLGLPCLRDKRMGARSLNPSFPEGNQGSKSPAFVGGTGGGEGVPGTPQRVLGRRQPPSEPLRGLKPTSRGWRSVPAVRLLRPLSRRGHPVDPSRTAQEASSRRGRSLQGVRRPPGTQGGHLAVPAVMTPPKPFPDRREKQVVPAVQKLRTRGSLLPSFATPGTTREEPAGCQLAAEATLFLKDQGFSRAR